MQDHPLTPPDCTFSRLPTLCRALLKASLFSFVVLDSMGLGLGVFRSSCALATLYAVLTEKLVPSRPWDVAALAAAGTDCCSKTCSAKYSCCEALKSFCGLNELYLQQFRAACNAGSTSPRTDAAFL